jgi:hypothetical protein
MGAKFAYENILIAKGTWYGEISYGKKMKEFLYSMAGDNGDNTKQEVYKGGM